MDEIEKYIDGIKKEMLTMGINPVHVIAVGFLLDDLKKMIRKEMADGDASLEEKI